MTPVVLAILTPTVRSLHPFGPLQIEISVISVSNGHQQLLTPTRGRFVDYGNYESGRDIDWSVQKMHACICTLPPKDVCLGSRPQQQVDRRAHPHLSKEGDSRSVCNNDFLASQAHSGDLLTIDACACDNGNNALCDRYFSPSNSFLNRSLNRIIADVNRTFLLKKISLLTLHQLVSLYLNGLVLPGVLCCRV